MILALGMLIVVASIAMHDAKPATWTNVWIFVAGLVMIAIGVSRW